MRRTRNAKIVATLGPASSSEDIVRQLFMAGVDVFRLNFSHGSADDHRARFAVLRRLERETARPIGILADLALAWGVHSVHILDSRYLMYGNPSGLLGAPSLALLAFSWVDAPTRNWVVSRPLESIPVSRAPLSRAASP